MLEAGERGLDFLSEFEELLPHVQVIIVSGERLSDLQELIWRAPDWEGLPIQRAFFEDEAEEDVRFRHFSHPP